MQRAGRKSVAGLTFIILAAPSLGFPEVHAASLSEPKVIASLNAQKGGGFGLGVKRLPDLTGDGIEELWLSTSGNESWTTQRI